MDWQKVEGVQRQGGGGGGHNIPANMAEGYLRCAGSQDRGDSEPDKYDLKIHSYFVCLQIDVSDSIPVMV